MPSSRLELVILRGDKGASADDLLGWDQAANGNLGWPSDFGLSIYSDQPVTHDVWIFGAIQGIMWFSAAVLGSYLSDPISEHIGR